MRFVSLAPALALLILPASAAAQDAAGDEPTARELLTRADAEYAAEEWTPCADTYGRAADRGGRAVRRHAAYNAACCHALAGDVDAAFAELERAIEARFEDVDLLRRDTDLEILHGDARWEATVARAEAAAQAYLDSINQEVRDLFHQDQADRRPPEGEEIDWDVVTPRDEARRARVREMMEAHELKAADDYYHAAMVLQHGSELEDYRVAHELCLQAVQLDPEHTGARWLAAAALDRWLVNQDKPQRYGTQFRKVDGRWELCEVDPAVTDEERAEWNVPSLAEAQARAERMND
jgi:hypothetical protein